MLKNPSRNRKPLKAHKASSKRKTKSEKLKARPLVRNGRPSYFDDDRAWMDW